MCRALDVPRRIGRHRTVKRIVVIIVLSMCVLANRDESLQGNGYHQPVLPATYQVGFNTAGGPLISVNRVREVPAKPAHTIITPRVDPYHITVKFVENSKIRLRNGGLRSLNSFDVSGVDAFSKVFHQGKWHRLFTRSE